MTPQGIGKLMDGVASQMETAVNGLRRTYKDVVRYELGYETQGLHKSVTEAHRAVQWLLNDVVHRETALKRWVSLMGASGCGKSHLAAAAVRVLREQGFRARRVQCWSWRKVMGRLLEDPGLMSWLADLHVLALDDIGTGFTASQKAAALNASLLYELLEARLGKWTIITSNLSPGDVAETLDVRIASRLYRGLNVIVDMSCADDFCLMRYKQQHEGGGAR